MEHTCTGPHWEKSFSTTCLVRFIALDGISAQNSLEGVQWNVSIEIISHLFQQTSLRVCKWEAKWMTRPRVDVTLAKLSVPSLLFVVVMTRHVKGNKRMQKGRSNPNLRAGDKIKLKLKKKSTFINWNKLKKNKVYKIFCLFWSHY